MNESSIKRIIVDVIRSENGYARRIEDMFSVGMPDLILIPIRCPCIWAEVKIIKGQSFGPTERQLVELERLRRVPYSLGMMLGWKEGVLYSSKPKLKIHISECDEQHKDEKLSDFIRRSSYHV